MQDGSRGLEHMGFGVGLTSDRRIWTIFFDGCSGELEPDSTTCGALSDFRGDHSHTKEEQEKNLKIFQ